MTRLSLFLVAGVSALALTSAVQAADLIIEEPVVGVVDVGGNWDGAYIGAFIGGAWGTSDHANDPADMAGFCLPDGCDMDISGLLAGVTVGANFTVSDGVVAGIAGDIAWSDVSGAENFGGFDTTHTINWQGSVRGVLGFDGGAFMPYLTGGLAFANATHTIDFGGILEADATHVGWTVGAGVAIAATEDIVIDLQYRYSDFGEQTYNEGAPVEPIFGLTQHSVTAGVNFLF